MAFLPGIFGKAPAPAPAPAAPAPASGGSLPAAQQQQPSNPAANPASMPGQQAAPAAGGPVNPMDAFKTMFERKPADPNAPKTPSMNDPVLGPLDPAAFKQQVATANFAAGIPQDTLQKAISGDANALMEAINHASREAFAAAAQLSHGLVEHGVKTGGERFNSTLDSRIRNFQIKSQNTNHEALAHPAVAPMLNAVKMQIATSNPQLSPSEVQSQAEQYFTQMADVLVAPKQAATKAAATPKETDFSSYLQ